MEENKSKEEMKNSFQSYLNHPKRGKNKKKIIFIMILVTIALAGSTFFLYQNFRGKEEKTNQKTKVKKVYSKYRMSGNHLEDFDLSFLKLEQEKKNTVYSPLSIKYALGMLSEGAKGQTKEQIDSVIGEYQARKYNNNSNMSFANAMFIRNSYKDQIKEKYTSNLQNKYSAEVIFDSFETADNVNSWVNNKTFGLIHNLFDSISDYEYILVNALAIDMEWNQYIQEDGSGKGNIYYVTYPHINYEAEVDIIAGEEDYSSIPFYHNSMNAKSVEIGASVNHYDIVKELGEDNIRKTVGEGYQKWLKDPNRVSCGEDLDVNQFLDKYIKELNQNYKKVDTSTDFSFYHDEEVKLFAKDLKQYNNTTLQYVGIMPKQEELNDYISKINAKEINDLIGQLKTVELNNFEYGKVYKIIGTIPLFKFEYELDLIHDLEKLGIKDVFDSKKADLSNLSKEKSYIGKASHKANIEFSNQGIKASAVTMAGGLGSVGCGYEYKYDVPIETIDMTFDQPYLFLIRDKTTGEVWFSGKVYQPTVK